MPHECTTCGRTFPDGSKEMLSGCPDCGGNKFQFHPSGKSGSADPSRDVPDPSDPPAESPSPSSSESSFSFGASRSSDTETESVVDPEPDTETGSVVDPEPDTETVEDESAVPCEDRAQASARRSFVSEDELHEADADGSTEPTTRADTDASSVDTGTTSADSSADSGVEPAEEPEPADLAELRDELNDQFESIKIHARGEYELNLMELYDREEHIIALEEDGRYAIDVPSSWRDAEEDG